MVYVSWCNPGEDEPNIVPCDNMEEAKEFCKENGLKPEECCDVMDW